jgi:hypothetical protein
VLCYICEGQGFASLRMGRKLVETIRVQVPRTNTLVSGLPPKQFTVMDDVGSIPILGTQKG